jgi:hypothetical protein
MQVVLFSTTSKSIASLGIMFHSTIFKFDKAL